MKLNAITAAFVGSAALALASGCASSLDEGADDTIAPEAEVDVSEPSGIIYTPDGLWSANAGQPGRVVRNQNLVEVRGNAVFTGPAGQTRKMGVCLLKRYGVVTCNTAADCGAAPPTLPAGGWRYCLAENGSATKYCYYRPGTDKNYCAGTPALDGYPPVGPGTYFTPWQTGGGGGIGWNGRWMSTACFSGCTGETSEPSSSSSALVVNPPNGPGPGEP